MGGIVNAFATDVSEDAAVNAAPRDRRVPEGVGSVDGTLEWRVAERSRRAAIGVVKGR
jgi:hypothetical protein